MTRRIKYSSHMATWNKLPVIPVQNQIYLALKAEDVPVSQKVREILADYYKIPI